MKKNVKQTYAALDFLFDSEFNVNEITERFGIKPKNAYCKNEKYFTNREKTRDHGRWTYYSPYLENCDSLNDLLETMFNPIEDKIISLRDYVVQNNGEIRLVIYVMPYTNKFDLSISGKAKNLLHTLNPDIEFDLMK